MPACDFYSLSDADFVELCGAPRKLGALLR
jgi:hypothetical protein